MNRFSDFIKENDNEKIKGDDKLSQDISELIGKYSELSNEELMNEFMKESAKKKNEGELSETHLNSIKKILKPYLNQEQSSKLDTLLDKIK